MCIAILKTKKGIITDEALINSFEHNSDGAGIAFTKNKKLYIVKGIFNKNEFVKQFREIEKVADNNILIHCRIGTSGTKDKNNTHPFIINENVCLIHNGILDIDVPKNSKENDTRIFIRRYLKDISTGNLLHNKCILQMIADLIGSSNKFVLMDNKGYYQIINENKGHWKNDVWYSNSTYEAPKYNYNWYDTYSYGTSYKWNGRYWDYDNEEDNIDKESLHYMVQENLYHLSDSELLEIKEEPIIYTKTGEIISKDTFDSSYAYYQPNDFTWLEDEFPDLYEEYLELYYDIAEKDNMQMKIDFSKQL